MKIVVDIDEDYYEIIKHDVKVNHNPFKPYSIIVNGTPLPQKKKHKEEIDYEYGYIDGWNECLDKITGETE